MIFLLFIILTALYSITEAFESSDEKVVEKFLSDYYDFDSGTDKLNDAVKDIQRMAGITEDGKISKELLAHIAKSRCGKEDKQKTSKRYKLMDQKWDKGTTYRFFIHAGRHPRTMDIGAIRRAITIGIQYWSTAADIYFGESAETRGSMFSISFADAEHIMYNVHSNFAESRDPYPLDNVRGNVLAHAYNPRIGNLHLDSAEEWTEGKQNGINLRIVVAHEMGHAIGLHHSDTSQALMYPAYTGYVPENVYKLPSDDSQGAIAIYGPRRKLRSLPIEKKNRKRSVNEKELCEATNINAAFEFVDGMVYAVSNQNKVFHIINNSIDKTFKTFTIQKDLQNSDAIFTDYSGMRLIVFKDNKIFSASGPYVDKLTVAELEIAEQGAFQGKVSAAFARDKNYKSSIQKFWAIQDGKLISGRIEKNKVTFSGRTTKLSDILKMSGGGHFPPSVDGAFLTGKENTLRLVLFVGNSVYIGTPSGRKNVIFTIPAEYPKTFKQVLHC